MKSENRLVQKAGCRECSLARKEKQDRFGNLILTKEICRFGGRIAIEAGANVKYSCSQ